MTIARTPATEVFSTRLNSADTAALDKYCAEHGCNYSEAIAALVRLGSFVSAGPVEPGVPSIAPNALGAVDLTISFTPAQWDLCRRIMRILAEYPNSN